MKVVCDSCHAKYQVADERVAGKKLKIRCRRCAGTIIVRGDQSPPSASAQSLPPVSSPELSASAVAWSDSAPDLAGLASSPSAASSPSTPPIETPAVAAPEVDMPEAPQAAEWFASVNDGEHGPMSLEDLVAWLAANPQGWGAHVWRDGFPDWVELRYVDMIVEAATAAGLEEHSETEQVDEDAEPTQLASSSSIQVNDEERATSVARAPEPQPQHSTPEVQVSEAQVSEAQVSEPVVMRQSQQAAVSQPRVSGAAAFSGSRNEESVLFNVADLQKVASGSAASAPPVSSPGVAASSYSSQNYSLTGLSSPNPSSAATSSSPGFASGDGSGLIDIRALAALSKTMQAQADSIVEPESGFILPEAGAPAATLPAIDTLAPVADIATRQPNKALPVAIVSAAVIVAAAVVTVAFVLKAPVIAADPAQAAAASAVVAPSMAPPASAMPPAVPAKPASTSTDEPLVMADGQTPGGLNGSDEVAEDATPSDSDVSAAPREPVGPVAKTAPKKRARGVRRKRTVPSKRKPARSSDGAKGKEASDELSAAQPPAKKARKEVSLDDVFSDAPVKSSKSAESTAKSNESSGASVDELLAGTAPAPKKKAALAQNRSLDDLLNGAGDAQASSKKIADAQPSAPTENLAAQPSRNNVISAMRGVTPAIQRCASKNSVSGIAKVKVMVAGSSGKVTQATITGVTGRVVACIGGAVRKAKFPKFSKPSFSVTFPFRL